MSAIMFEQEIQQLSEELATSQHIVLNIASSILGRKVNEASLHAIIGGKIGYMPMFGIELSHVLRNSLQYGLMLCTKTIYREKSEMSLWIELAIAMPCCYMNQKS